MPLTALSEILPRSECKIELKNGYRYFTANGIPNHATGQFPNSGNPNSISAQDYHVRVTMNPVPAGAAAPGQYRGYTFGIAINGVMFDPGTAEFWNNDPRWTYEALTGMMVSRGSLGIADQGPGTGQPDDAGNQHYRRNSEEPGVPCAMILDPANEPRGESIAEQVDD